LADPRRGGPAGGSGPGPGGLPAAADDTGAQGDDGAPRRRSRLAAGPSAAGRARPRRRAGARRRTRGARLRSGRTGGRLSEGWPLGITGGGGLYGTGRFVERSAVMRAGAATGVSGRAAG